MARGFRQEQRRVALAMGGALLVTIAVLCAAGFFGMDAAPAPFGARMRETLRLDVVVILWLAGTIANVARLRFFSERDIAGSGSGEGSDAVKVASAILQNSLEQAVLAIATHLIVAATFARSGDLIAALVGLFVAGRLLFAIGYHHGAAARAFGFALTFYPSVLALIGCAASIAFG